MCNQGPAVVLRLCFLTLLSARLIQLRTHSNGRTPGISLPSGELQEAVIRKAYDDAGLDFSGTDYVECHGTGTAVGDPIEVNAVGKCFASRTGSPLLIGSVSDLSRSILAC